MSKFFSMLFLTACMITCIITNIMRGAFWVLPITVCAAFVDAICAVRAYKIWREEEKEEK